MTTSLELALLAGSYCSHEDESNYVEVQPAGVTTERLADWGNPGEATVATHPEMAITGKSPTYTYAYLWSPNVEIPSYFIVEGTPNEQLPGGGPQLGDDDFPMLYIEVDGNFWDTGWSGEQWVALGKDYQAFANFDSRSGSGWLWYLTPNPDVKYTRYLDMAVYEPTAWIKDVTPGPGGPG